jgi:hypothetical protein
MSNPANVKRRCIFCDGAKKTTKEDVWPKWTSELMRSYLPAFQGVTVVRNDIPERLEPDVTALANVVCHVCNNGWMSRLENRVKPLLSRMIVGDVGIPLTTRDQELLASWAFKTALLLDHIYPKNRRRYTPDLYHKYYRERRPPSYCHIWTGCYVDRHIQFWSHTAIVDMPVPPKYDDCGVQINPGSKVPPIISTFRLFRAVFQMVLFDPATHSHETSDEHGTFKIHPAQPQTVNWPYQNIGFDDAQVKAYEHRRFKVKMTID